MSAIMSPYFFMQLPYLAIFYQEQTGKRIRRSVIISKAS